MNQEKKLELLTALAKLSPPALAALQTLAERLPDIEKMSEQEFAALLAKASRAGALAAGKPQSNELRKSAGKKTWGEHYGITLGTPLSLIR